MDEKRIKDIVSQMTLEEKISICSCGTDLVVRSLAKYKIQSVKLPNKILSQRDDLSALGCTFDVELAAEYGKKLSDDAIKNGEAIGGVVNLGIVREPMRTGSEKMLGEDALACSEMAKAIVESASVKLLASGLLGGEYPYSERYIDNRAIMELYLRPFLTVADSLGGAIIPSGSINGEMACESKWLINKITESMPKGLIMSEFGAVRCGEDSLVAANVFEVTDDKSGMSNVYNSIKIGKIDEKFLNENVERVLTLANNVSAQELSRPKNDNKFNKRLAEESIVLLKNNMELPLTAGATIGVFGDITKAESLILASPSRGNNNFNVCYKKPGKYPAVVFLRLQGQQYTALQQQEVEIAAKNCESVIVVLLSSRPAPLAFEGLVNAVLYVPLFNEFTMQIVSNMLVGQVNPSGKLSVSYAYQAKDYPALNYAKASGRGMFCYESVLNGYRYFSSFSRGVLYPFGHGLSYTGFEISGLKTAYVGDSLQLDFIVKNVGMVSGVATVFVFGNLYQDNILGLRSRLQAFKKVCLDSGEQKAEHMTVDKQAFSVYNESTCEWIIPGGRLEIFVGFSAMDKRVSTTVKLPYSTKISLGLGVKEAPSYYNPDAFNPLGADVEKVMKTPLLVKKNPLEDFCIKTEGEQRNKLVKLCTKKLIKTAKLKANDAQSLLENMSDYALKKL